MRLEQLEITCVRNILSASFAFHPKLNFICGPNGSGKTSVLEAIYLLSLGRSFRTLNASHLITFAKDECTVFSRVSGGKLGVSRSKKGDFRIKIDEREGATIADLTRKIPVQLLNATTFDLLEAGPQERRKFLDWGVFHVEHLFFTTWQRYRRALTQRNAALKASSYRTKHAITVWDRELVETGELLDGYRAHYLARLEPVLREVLLELLPGISVSLDYQRGWDKTKDLQTALKDGFNDHIRLGYTTAGSHRADIVFHVEHGCAKHILSRGQTKLFVAGLLVAQARVIKESLGQGSLFLIDDLKAELDEEATKRLLNLLCQLDLQVIITSVAQEQLLSSIEGYRGLSSCQPFRVFHVEHGRPVLRTNTAPLDEERQKQADYNIVF